MIKNIDGVDWAIEQNNVLYDEVLNSIKPDYVVHGDNWNEYPDSVIKENVLKNLSKYGGELIEVPYTYNAKVLKSLFFVWFKENVWKRGVD